MDQSSAAPHLPPVFSVDAARRAGLNDYQLRDTRLLSPSRGLRAWAHTAPQWMDLVHAISQLDGDHWLSHTTAARLWGVWLPIGLRQETAIHVTGRKSTTGARRRPGVVGHRATLDPADVTELNGFRLTTPARTWLDLAPMFEDPADLIAAGDALLQRSDGPPRHPNTLGSNPLSTLAEIDDTMARRRSVKGIQRARAARPLLRAGVDSAPESRMRWVLVRSGLPEPTVNPRIKLASGVWRQPDLALIEWQLVFQYEGRRHANAAQIAKDIRRDDDFERFHWRSVRAGHDLYTARGERAFLDRVRRALREQHERGIGPAPSPTEHPSRS